MGFAQETKRITLNFNDTTFIRILNGVVLDNHDEAQYGVRDVFRVSDLGGILKKIDLPENGKPYMILNTNLEGYEKLKSLLPENLRKFQVPLIKNDTIISINQLQNIPIQNVKYSDKKTIGTKKIPFSFLEVI